jgi:hypothetical protein
MHSISASEPTEKPATVVGAIARKSSSESTNTVVGWSIMVDQMAYFPRSLMGKLGMRYSHSGQVAYGIGTGACFAPKLGARGSWCDVIVGMRPNMENLATMSNTPAERAPMRRDGVLVTEAVRTFGPMTCEGCGATHPGGTARGLLLEERDGSETPWVLWAMGDGWTTTDELAGSMAICPADQANGLVRILRFVTEDAGALPAALELPR